MSTTPAKHIIKFLSAFVRVANLTANGASATVTTAITTALSTAGEAASSVPLQAAAATGLGVLTTAPNNRCEVYNATSKDKFLANNGEEVYARLTEASGAYTLSFYTLPNNGTETAYTFSAPTAIDFEFAYRFDFGRLPGDAIIGVSTRNVSQDPSINAGTAFLERLSPSAQNTLPSVAKTPTSATTFKLIVNGIVYDSLGGAAAFYTVNISTKAVTWSAANAGFNIDTTDRVIAEYLTVE